jgi:hypothetical protein
MAYTKEIRAVILSQIGAHLEVVDDEYDPLIDGITKEVAILFRKAIADLKKEHKAEIFKLKEASDSGDEKVQKKTKSGGKRKANKYSKFVGQLKYLKPEGKEGETRSDHPGLAGIEVQVKENFADKASASAKRYEDHKEWLLHGEEPIVGQTMTLAELYDVLTEAKSLDSGFSNGMTRAGLLWGLMDEETRKKVVAGGDE